MNEEIQLNKWWSSLPISDKERLSGRNYPACTIWWNELSIPDRSTTYHKSGIERAKRNKSRGFT